SSNTDIELVRITALVLDPAESGEFARGVAGAGLATSWARPELGRMPHAAASAAYTKTLMLTPNLTLLFLLETICAVDRNAVLIVIAQEGIRVFARALITYAECHMW